MSDASLPTYALDGNVAVITIDDGKANVLSSEVIAELEKHLDQALADDAHALLIVGRPGRFSAGFNLEEMTASVESMRGLVERGGQLLLRLYGFGMPTVAACTGHALAGGAITLMACDVRIGADVPCKIGLNEVAIGMGLPRFVVEFARDRLAEELLTDSTCGARLYDAHGAVEAGYLDRAVPGDEVVAAATAEARRLAELSTGAYALTKTQLRGEMIERELGRLRADLETISTPTPA